VYRVKKRNENIFEVNRSTGVIAKGSLAGRGLGWAIDASDECQDDTIWILQ
jgi:hypothetical protein